jgi:hypothetical protein
MRNLNWFCEGLISEAFVAAPATGATTSYVKIPGYSTRQEGHGFDM